MDNLLKQTLEAIRESGHIINDIDFIGSEDGYECDWDTFKKLADQEYDSGFGSANVATDLIIVFRDGQKMWRGEYDGSEWWEYSTPFTRPKNPKPLKRLIGRYWPSLKSLQDDSDAHHNPSLATPPIKGKD